MHGVMEKRMRKNATAEKKRSSGNWLKNMRRGSDRASGKAPAGTQELSGTPLVK
jgi:hypothetical protein